MAPFLLKDWISTTTQVDKPVLGIPVGPYLKIAEPDMLTHFSRNCLELRQAGWDVQEVPVMHDFDRITKNHHNIVSFEAAKIHREWFQNYRNRYHPKTAILILRGQEIPLKEYQYSLEGRDKFRQTLIEIMESSGVDIWLSPSAPGVAPFGLESTGDPIMNLPWSHCGFPTINLPSGNSASGLPYGLQLSTKWMQDEALLGWASKIVPVIS
jgi:Asp-tRNA(Asn)/Glu-tRNA(Gln) amidotransferase A subunit family amidase